ncbi:MAG TPA: ABC transporter permease subunit [Candidatus Acidoferrales bacterium]|jgi:ABC-2 type transport system permease protein|nr:ABC transporter permease subunit [Candidatus Acidoferrales bacterium]
MSAQRVRAIFRKELREFRHNGSIVATMAVLPVIFTIPPLIAVLELASSQAGGLLNGDPLAYLLGIPALVPATIAAYAVVGERQQGTLEPVLTTPIRREEFLLGKALAALIPTLLISYVVFGLFLAVVALFAHPAVASAAFQGRDLIAQVLFTPLIAGWAIWLGMAISTRVSEIRVAQQLGVVASVPSAIVTALIAYDVIKITPALVIFFAALLLVLDVAGYRFVSALFDRERLMSGSRS